MSMLKTIKDELRRPYETFDKFYDDYIMKLQDYNIDHEVSRLRRINNITAHTIHSLGLAIDKAYMEVDTSGFGDKVSKCV